MIDAGAKFTDEELKKLEEEIIEIYKEASVDISKKLKDFTEKYKTKEQIHLKELSEGKITQEQFDAWKRGQVFQGEQWKSKREQIGDTISNANQMATDILNGRMVDVFTGNANFMSYAMEHDTGINFGFGIYDSATVVNLIKNDPQLLPEWKINEPKDYIWNQKNVNRAITQGIIQGERLDQIADRLANGLGTKNKNKMLTFARTAMTGSQNAGRVYSIDAAKDLGIDVEKEWMCTLDLHTRTNHRLLDGQSRPTDKPFEISGYKIMYPGDPAAAPEMVYNCRCTLVSNVKKYPSEYDRYDNIKGERVKHMTYSEWEAENKRLAAQAEEAVRMLDESEATGLVSLFSNKKMSNLYNEMREIDTKTATAFYNELKSMGKPSEVWNQYINGTLPDNVDTSRLNGILQSYAEKKGMNIPNIGTGGKPTPVAGKSFKEIFGGKKMSNVYNEMKGVDSKIANQFYKELGSMGKPSDVWQKYLDGKLTDEQRTRIEKFLGDYADKAGLIKPTGPAGIDIKGLVGNKKMSNFYNELKGKNSKLANQFYKELQGLGKPSEVWQKYINGEIKNSKIDDILRQHFGQQSIVKPKGPEIKPKPIIKPKTADRTWVEKNIDNNKFKENAKNITKARQKVIDDIMKTPENYRKCFADTLSKINFFDDNGKAYYINGRSKISVNLDKVHRRDGSYGTLFHEVGHAIDYEYMRLRNPNKSDWFLTNKDRTSQLPSFLSAIEKDLKNISKEMDNPRSPISMYYRDSMDDASKGVQDFFAALKPLNDQGPRKGKIPQNLLGIRYRWGHSYEYYTRENDPMVDAASELFANISGGYGDPNQMKYMKKYFPNAVSAFDDIIDEMAKNIVL